MHELLTHLGEIFRALPVAWIVLIFILGLLVGYVVARTPVRTARLGRRMAGRR